MDKKVENTYNIRTGPHTYEHGKAVKKYHCKIYVNAFILQQRERESEKTYNSIMMR